MRGAQEADKDTFQAWYKGADGFEARSKALTARYMERFAAGSSGPGDDPQLDEAIVEVRGCF